MKKSIKEKHIGKKMNNENVQKHYKNSKNEKQKSEGCQLFYSSAQKCKKENEEIIEHIKGNGKTQELKGKTDMFIISA